eukprot:CFRG0961T1
MTSTDKTTGISGAISSAKPTKKDLALSQRLETALHQYGVFESAEDAKMREVVLDTLSMIVETWVKDVIEKKTGIPAPAKTTGRIFTFGSYRMGVHQQGADIDTLCVTPRQVDRDDFFSSLFNILKGRKEVTELTSVPDAYVPVIKMEFNGIPIDLLMAKLERDTIEQGIDLLDVSLLESLDQKSVLSLNGCRVTDQILKLVPNKDNFRMALRAIKMWAKRRAIYSNAMGFLGGVAWAMMVARVCQLYPNACPATLVSRFFRVYHQWSWPNPVLLRTLEDANLGFAVWNPKLNPRDIMHLMPIITPAYPAMNSTHNVMNSNLRLLKAEFKRGMDITLHVESGEKRWEELFTRTEFFFRYKQFVRIDAIATNEADHHLWEGLIEARIRVLVASLERVPGLAGACPLPESFTSKSVMMKGTDVEVTPDEKVGSEETYALYRTIYFIGLDFQRNLEGGKRRIELGLAERDFWAKMTAWDKFNGETMTMDITTVHRKKLPSFVYKDRDLTKSTDRNYVSLNNTKTEENLATLGGSSPFREQISTPVETGSDKATIKDESEVETIKPESV